MYALFFLFPISCGHFDTIPESPFLTSPLIPQIPLYGPNIGVTTRISTHIRHLYQNVDMIRGDHVVQDRQTIAFACFIHPIYPPPSTPRILLSACAMEFQRGYDRTGRAGVRWCPQSSPPRQCPHAVPRRGRRSRRHQAGCCNRPWYRGGSWMSRSRPSPAGGSRWP